MNLEDAEQIEIQYERWDSKQARRALFERMERKLFRRQRNRMARLAPRKGAANLKSHTAQ
jgi:hypothetical protein